MANNAQNAWKGGRFRAWLIGQLLLKEEFSVAVPEPDLGDDLWVRRLCRRGANGEFVPVSGPSPVIRAQMKSSFATVLSKGGDKKYVINDSPTAFENRIAFSYIYFVGLFDKERHTFDFGCIPSGFFKETWDAGLLRITDKDKKPRVMLDFFVSDQGKARRFSFHWKRKIDVTRFFNCFDAIS